MGEVGLTPKQFYCMTEHEYYKILIGHKNKTLNELRKHRQLAYYMATMNADPKKIPSIHKFMPLEGDVITTYTPPEKEKLKLWDSVFRKLGKARK